MAPQTILRFFVGWPTWIVGGGLLGLLGLLSIARHRASPQCRLFILGSGITFMGLMATGLAGQLAVYVRSYPSGTEESLRIATATSWLFTIAVIVTGVTAIIFSVTLLSQQYRELNGRTEQTEGSRE